MITQGPDLIESYSLRLCRCGAAMHRTTLDATPRWKCEECERTAR